MQQAFDENNSPTNEATARILALLQIFSGGEWTFEEVLFHPKLKDFYRVSQEPDRFGKDRARARRMFDRDLLFLRQNGWNIARDQGSRYVLQASVSGPLFTFSESHLEVLVFLRCLFADPIQVISKDSLKPLPALPVRHPFGESIIAFIEYLTTTLTPGQRQEYKRRIDYPIVFPNIETYDEFSQQKEKIAFLMEARIARRKIHFSYQPLRKTQQVYRAIHPYGIVFRDGHAYLMAYEELKDKTVEFRIDRIADPITYDGPRRVDSLRPFRLISFRYWIPAEFGTPTRWVTQTVEKEEVVEVAEGKSVRRLLVKAQAYSRFQIVKQMLGYGDQAELIDPLDIRDEIRATVARMLQNYS